MSQRNLTLQAEQCRAQAQTFQGPERQLLLKIAEVFESISKPQDEPNPVDSIRCW